MARFFAQETPSDVDEAFLILKRVLGRRWNKQTKKKNVHAFIETTNRKFGLGREFWEFVEENWECLRLSSLTELKKRIHDVFSFYSTVNDNVRDWWSFVVDEFPELSSSRNLKPFALKTYEEGLVLHDVLVEALEEFPVPSFMRDNEVKHWLRSLWEWVGVLQDDENTNDHELTDDEFSDAVRYRRRFLHRYCVLISPVARSSWYRSEVENNAYALRFRFEGALFQKNFFQRREPFSTFDVRVNEYMKNTLVSEMKFKRSEHGL